VVELLYHAKMPYKIGLTQTAHFFVALHKILLTVLPYTTRNILFARLELHPLA